MPQMAPMNWKILLTLFTMMITAMMIMLTLYSIKTPLPNPTFMPSYTKKYMNKW